MTNRSKVNKIDQNRSKGFGHVALIFDICEIIGMVSVGKIKDYGEKKNYWNVGRVGESEKGTGCGTTVHSLLRGNTPFYALAGVQKRNAGDRGFHGMG